LVIKNFENKDFEAFFYIFSNSLGISLAIGDIYYLNIYIFDIWQLKNPKTPKFCHFEIKNLTFGNFSKKKKKVTSG